MQNGPVALDAPVGVNMQYPVSAMSYYQPPAVPPMQMPPMNGAPPVPDRSHQPNMMQQQPTSSYQGLSSSAPLPALPPRSHQPQLNNNFPQPPYNAPYPQQPQFQQQPYQLAQPPPLPPHNPPLASSDSHSSNSNIPAVPSRATQPHGLASSAPGHAGMAPPTPDRSTQPRLNEPGYTAPPGYMVHAPSPAPPPLPPHALPPAHAPSPSTPFHAPPHQQQQYQPQVKLPRDYFPPAVPVYQLGGQLSGFQQQPPPPQQQYQPQQLQQQQPPPVFAQAQVPLPPRMAASTYSLSVLSVPNDVPPPVAAVSHPPPQLPPHQTQPAPAPYQPPPVAAESLASAPTLIVTPSGGPPLPAKPAAASSAESAPSIAPARPAPSVSSQPTLPPKQPAQTNSNPYTNGVHPKPPRPLHKGHAISNSSPALGDQAEEQWPPKAKEIQSSAPVATRSNQAKLSKPPHLQSSRSEGALGQSAPVNSKQKMTPEEKKAKMKEDMKAGVAKQLKNHKQMHATFKAKIEEKEMGPIGGHPASEPTTPAVAHRGETNSDSASEHEPGYDQYKHTQPKPLPVPKKKASRSNEGNLLVVSSPRTQRSSSVDEGKKLVIADSTAAEAQSSLERPPRPAPMRPGAVSSRQPSVRTETEMDSNAARQRSITEPPPRPPLPNPSLLAQSSAAPVDTQQQTRPSAVHNASNSLKPAHHTVRHNKSHSYDPDFVPSTATVTPATTSRPTGKPQPPKAQTLRPRATTNTNDVYDYYNNHQPLQQQVMFRERPAALVGKGAMPATPVFGVNPEQLELVTDRGHQVPKVLSILGRWFEELGGYNEEGVFRLAGEEKEMADLKAALNNKQETYPRRPNVHSVATLIKRWYGELPVRMFEALKPMTLDACLEGDEKACLSFTEGLREPYRPLALWLLDLLARVTANESVTRMSPNNIGVVVAPVLAPRVADPLEGMVITGKVTNTICVYLKARRSK